MGQAVETKTEEGVVREHDVDIPTGTNVIVTANVRETVAQKFEELAAKLRSGALNGASCMWNDNPDQPAMVVVTCHPVIDGKRTMRMDRYTFEAPVRLVTREGG
jgi:hypothetical protein